jgi:hypothetical protein
VEEAAEEDAPVKSTKAGRSGSVKPITGMKRKASNGKRGGRGKTKKATEASVPGGDADAGRIATAPTSLLAVVSPQGNCAGKRGGLSLGSLLQPSCKSEGFPMVMWVVATSASIPYLCSSD